MHFTFSEMEEALSKMIWHIFIAIFEIKYFLGRFRVRIVTRFTDVFL